MTIQEEGGVDEASDAIKKIILNFLQVVSLAGGLPLQWPGFLTWIQEKLETRFFFSVTSRSRTDPFFL